MHWKLVFSIYQNTQNTTNTNYYNYLNKRDVSTHNQQKKCIKKYIKTKNKMTQLS